MDVAEELPSWGWRSIALVLLSIVRTSIELLSSSIGIARDGFQRGKVVPSWNLSEVEEYLRVTLAGNYCQFLIFANRSFASFSDFFSGMQHLGDSNQRSNLEIRQGESLCGCSALGRGHCASRDVPSDALVTIRFLRSQKSYWLREVAR